MSFRCMSSLSFALALASMAASAIAQDTTERPRSLAARLTELRESWSNPEAEQRIAPAAATSEGIEGQRGYIAVAAESVRGSLPRVNPRNLMSGNATTAQPATAGCANRYGATGGDRTRPGSHNSRRTGDIAADLGVGAASPVPAPSTGFGHPISPDLSRERAGSAFSGATAAANAPAVDAATKPNQGRVDVAHELRSEFVGSGSASRSTSGFGATGDGGPARVASRQTNSSSSTGYASAAEAAAHALKPGDNTAAPAAIDTTQAKPIAKTPAIAEVTTGKAAMEAANATTDSPFVTSSGASVSSITTSPTAPRSETESTISTGPSLLSTRELPLLTTRVNGPRQISVGQEATFTIQLDNQGRTAASEATTNVTVPAWAKVVRTSATRGVAREGASGIEWTVDRLQGGSGESLQLTLIPTTSQSIELGVAAHHAPISSTTTVEVQEPKLNVVVSGPQDVYFGRKQTFRLSISNPGTGTARNVRLGMVPPGSTTPNGVYRIAELAPGESKSIDVELTARQAGQLAVRAMAEADNGLTAEAEQQITCRKAELAIDWRGPERKYAGTPATYYLKVTNPGTAVAEKTALTVSLPGGFELAQSSDGGQVSSTGRQITWPVGSLAPGAELFAEFTGNLTASGANEFVLEVATQAGDAAARQVAATDVVAVADLELQIADPKGPVPVGDEVMYEVTVTNRGRSAAENVQVLALFSEGIEPLAVEGSSASIANGRVGFPPLAVFEAGATTTFKIRAKSLAAGAHVFRAEVLCRDLDIKLAAEETTQFYVDDNPTLDGNPSGEKKVDRYTPTW